MCPYKGHLPPVFLFFGFRDSLIIFEKPSCDCKEKKRKKKRNRKSRKSNKKEKEKEYSNFFCE